MNEELNTVITEAANPAMDIVEATASKSGKGGVVIMAATAGVLLFGGLIVGGIKLGAKLIDDHKEKKTMRKPENIVEPTQEQIDEATK